MDAKPTAKSPTEGAMELLQQIDDTQQTVTAFFANPWKVRWVKKKDPELVKAFSRISSRLVELRVYLERGTANAKQPVQAVASILKRITIHLGRDAAWDAAEDLKIGLLHVAPDEHLSSLLEAERAAPGQQENRWTTLYSEHELQEFREQSATAEKKGDGPPRWREVVIDRLATLYERRIDSWRHDRANAQLRARYFFAVTAVLGVVLGLTSILTVWQGKPFTGSVSTFLLTAMAAGALGSILSGVYKLRDEMMSIRQLRSFWPVLTAQPFVGATAATLLFAILELTRFGGHPR
jgi:hypothetical protein